jgi:hypothetical protein
MKNGRLRIVAAFASEARRSRASRSATVIVTAGERPAAATGVLAR